MVYPICFSVDLAGAEGLGKGKTGNGAVY